MIFRYKPEVHPKKEEASLFFDDFPTSLQKLKNFWSVWGHFEMKGDRYFANRISLQTAILHIFESQMLMLTKY